MSSAWSDCEGFSENANWYMLGQVSVCLILNTKARLPQETNGTRRSKHPCSDWLVSEASSFFLCVRPSLLLLMNCLAMRNEYKALPIVYYKTSLTKTSSDSTHSQFRCEFSQSRFITKTVIMQRIAFVLSVLIGLTAGAYEIRNSKITNPTTTTITTTAASVPGQEPCYDITFPLEGMHPTIGSRSCWDCCREEGMVPDEREFSRIVQRSTASQTTEIHCKCRDVITPRDIS